MRSANNEIVPVLNGYVIRWENRSWLCAGDRGGAYWGEHESQAMVFGSKLVATMVAVYWDTQRKRADKGNDNMAFKLPSADEVRSLCEEQGLSLHEGRNILTKEAIIEALEKAKTFAEAKEALLVLVRNSHISPPHPASYEARRRR